MSNIFRSNRNLFDGSLKDIDPPIPENYNLVTSCNTINERIQDYDEVWNWLGHIAIEYNWKYRKKICSVCPLETRQKLHCQKIENYRIVDSVKIQETHCSKLEKSRANKLRNHVRHVLALDPFTKYQIRATF